MADYTQPEYVERRVRYFDGQFLREQDFIDEQRYHLDRGRRLTRMTCTPGVLDGLAVAPVANAAKVTVAAGTALDGRGRQLVRAAGDTPLDLTGFVDRNEPVPVFVTITYREVEDGAPPGGGSPRWREDPELAAFVDGSADAPSSDTHVRLARVLVDPAGTAGVDPGFRAALGGLAVGGPAAVGGGLAVGGSAEVSGGMRGGGGEPLRVDGGLQVRGPRDFDATTRVDIVNGAADYGRTSLVLTGRFQDGNDAWQFGSGARNAVVFASNASASGQNVGAVGVEQHSVQLEGTSNTLGFLTRGRGNDPALAITQDGAVGVATTSPDPDVRLDVNGDVTIRQAFASGQVGRWRAAMEGGQIAVTILPGSPHNLMVLRRRQGALGFEFLVHVPAGTEGQWFGRFVCYDPQLGVLSNELPIVQGTPMLGNISAVVMTSGAAPWVLIAELHQITVVDG